MNQSKVKSEQNLDKLAEKDTKEREDKSKKSKSNIKLGLFTRRHSLKSKNKTHRRLKSQDFSPIDENLGSQYQSSKATEIKKSISSHNKLEGVVGVGNTTTTSNNKEDANVTPNGPNQGRKCNSLPREFKSKSATLANSSSHGKNLEHQDTESPSNRTNSNSSVNNNNILNQSASQSHAASINNNQQQVSNSSSISSIATSKSAVGVESNYAVPNSTVLASNSGISPSHAHTGSQSHHAGLNLNLNIPGPPPTSTPPTNIRRFRAGAVGVELEECTKRLMGWDKVHIPVPIREVVDELENNEKHLNTEKIYMSHVVYHHHQGSNSSFGSSKKSSSKHKLSMSSVSYGESNSGSSLSSSHKHKDEKEDHGKKTKSDKSSHSLGQLVKEYEDDIQPNLKKYDTHVLAGFIKLFLRDLPKHILTPKLLPKFEHIVSSVSKSGSSFGSSSKKGHSSEIAKLAYMKKEFNILFEQLPDSSKQILTVLCIHWSHVVTNKNNKVSLAHLTAALAPCLNCSKKLITAFIQHHAIIFGYQTIARYSRPVRWENDISDFALPNGKQQESDKNFLIEELQRQEWALNRVKIQLNVGWNDKNKNERYWEVQRIITQLHRYLKQIEKSEQDLIQKEKEKLDLIEENKLKQQIKILEIEQEEILKIQEEIRAGLEVEKNKISNLQMEISQKPSLVIDYEEEYLDTLTEDKLMEKIEDYISQGDKLLKEHNSLKNEIDNERALYLDKRIELRLMEEGLSGVDMAVVRGI